ncbi:tetratricopeptide repeat-containing protein [Streptomyces sp. NPDC048281]|uniref:tetratricopeptide repeat protein n=1 Tax=Streptomyces sp. NPDC048281 TaxID=3154715 RepID=UPI00343EBA74
MTAAHKARAEFAAQLKEVLRDAGGPTYEALVRHSEGRLSTTRIGVVLNAEFTRPVAWEFVDSFLTACSLCARNARVVPTTALYDREMWRGRHTTLTRILEILEDEPTTADSAFTIRPFPHPGNQSAPVWRDQPSQLLSAQYQVVPFTGRQGDLKRLEEWRDGEPDAAVTLLHGPGGRGKTRLAAHLAERSATRWKVWQVLRRSSRPAHAISPALPPLGSRSLFVIDYAERWPQQDLQALLERLAAQHRSRVRILLLARSAGTWWTTWQHDLNDANYRTDAIELPTLPNERTDTREEAFTTARDCFAAALGLPDPETVTCPANLTDDAFGLTLTIHMAALVAVDARLRSTAAPDDPARLSQYLLQREYAYWAKLHNDSPDVAIRPEIMAQAVYTATLTRPLDYDIALDALIHAGVDIPAGLSAGRVLNDHAVCYPAPEADTYLEPLYPDRLGEDFLALATPGYLAGPPSTGWAAKAPARLLGATTQGPASCCSWTRDALSILINTAERWPHVADRQLYPLLKAHPEIAMYAGSAALATLADFENVDLTVLETLEARFPTGPQADLDVGIAAVAQRLAAHRLATVRDPVSRARTLNELSVRQSFAGLQDDALASIQEGLRIWRELASTASKYKLGLAGSLHNLGLRLAAVGRPEEALAAIEETVAIRRGISQMIVDVSESEFAGSVGGLGKLRSSVESDLASSLNVVGELLAAAGRSQEALTATQEAIAVYRSVAEDTPQHRSELCGTLQNLGLRLAAVGRGEEALTAMREAISMRRSLVAADPAANEADLARSLSNLGKLLADASQWQLSVAPAEEAVAIYRRLARDNPAAHEPGLAISLNGLGGWLAAGLRWEEALGVIEEAIEIQMRLVQTNPAHVSDLAKSLQTSGLPLLAAGRMEDALAHTQDAVGIQRRLAEVDPAAHELALAHALNVWVMVCLEAQRDLPAALRATDEALKIYNRLAADCPGSFDTNIRVLLVMRMMLLMGHGREREAASIGVWLANHPVNAADGSRRSSDGRARRRRLGWPRWLRREE